MTKSSAIYSLLQIVFHKIIKTFAYFITSNFFILNMIHIINVKINSFDFALDTF